MNSQSVKEEIIEKIRMGKPAPVPMPEVPIYEFPGNPVENFISKLISFDGRAIKFKSRKNALEWLKSQPEINETSSIIYSSADGIEGNFTESDAADLRNARKIQTCITEGLLGVGEMGAIWVTDKSLNHAACALLAKKLFIFLDAGRIAGGLHEAYAALKINDTQYGSFFTGPSATADIEAVHITGAQGPIALTALIYNCADAKEPPELIVNPNADSSEWIKVEEEPD